MLMAGARCGVAFSPLAIRIAVESVKSANILRVTEPRVSDLLRGRIDLFSTDALIDMLPRPGVGVYLVVKSSRRDLKAP